MVMIDDYIDYTNKYKTIYGDRTIILIEVGSFFEIYAVKNEQENEGAVDIYTIADICNFQVSRKNKNITEISRKNHLMAGFPSYALSKHSQTLLNNGYTIVLIEQVTPPPNPERKITQILSPSMQINQSSIDGNYLMVTVWDIYTDILKNRILTLGIAGIDISTGRTWIYEVMRDTSGALDEFIRCFQMYQPSEIVFIGANLTTDERHKIEDSIGVRMNSTRSYHLLWDLDIDIYQKVSYQNQVLDKSYSGFGMLNGLEALMIDKYENARLAFIYMIQFGYEHCDLFVKDLLYPDHLCFEGHATLEYNSALQLQLISNNQSEKPLLSILNRCATAFASRRFREKLLQPINNVSTLKMQYQKIQNMIDSGNSVKIYNCLRGVLDIERMTRRMILGRFQPAEWCNFNNSMQNIIEASKLYENGNIEYIEKIVKNYIDTIHLDEASKYNMNDIKGNIFHEGLYHDVDEIVRKYKEAYKELEDLASTFEEGAKVEYNEREGYNIMMTKKRWETAKSQMKEFYQELKAKDFIAKPISSGSSVVRVNHKWIEERSMIIIKEGVALNELVTKYYKEFVATFSEKNKDKILRLVKDVADLDIISTCARNAIDYHYSCPIIKETENAASYINVKTLRHPIIELINNRVKYVPNDIHLGDDAKESGLLLFGMNSSGKSSFMKAIGLNIIMAQAGMFVAADEFEYKPYNRIFTRISGIDNIYRGWSTFTIEMLELKTILQNADSYSLVLGDELCSGTEATSGLAIVAAGINILIKKVATFIFATHLHELGKLDSIKTNKKVYIGHMHVEVNEDGILIFDRKLRKGIGSEMYGLEVCKGLGMPTEFLKLAHDFRCQITDSSREIVATKTSRYNSELHVQECKICGEGAVETHHINPQMLADKNGFIEYYHKNREFNLIPVCEKCHLNIHHGKIRVNGYKDTSEGIQLDYVKCENGIWYMRKTKRSKWSAIGKDELNDFCKKKNIIIDVSTKT